tara:strand:+ start:1816 stop:2160 length:345 start_codon:yes stop_codon:yes gene_type:complete
MFWGIVFFTLGNILAFFQFNAQFIWPWFKDKPLLTNAIFAIPMGMCFWYAVKHIVGETGLLWTSKLVGFGVSNVIFALLAYLFMKESMFTYKTMTCMLLAGAILMIQFSWPNPN